MHGSMPASRLSAYDAEIPSLSRFLCAASGKSLASVSSSCLSLSFTRSIASYSFGVDGECLLHERPLIMPPLSRQLIIRPRLPEYLSYSSQKFQPISISTPCSPFSRAHPSELVPPALSPVYHQPPLDDERIDAISYSVCPESLAALSVRRHFRFFDLNLQDYFGRYPPLTLDNFSNIVEKLWETLGLTDTNLKTLFVRKIFAARCFIRSGRIEKFHRVLQTYIYLRFDK